jgi:hypothetical protein
VSNVRTVRGRVEIRLDAPEVSTDGGLIALWKVDRQSGLTQSMASCLVDRRRAASVRHQAHKMLRQRVYGICAGWEDCNDFDTLKDDALYRLVLGEPPAAQPVLSRFENRIRARELYAMSNALVDLFIQNHRLSPPKQIVLDLDATEDPAHGQQEFEFYHGYYRKHCFLPLLAFASCDGSPMEMLGAILRPGNSHAGAAVPRSWPGWSNVLERPSLKPGFSFAPTQALPFRRCIRPAKTSVFLT